MSYMGNTKDSFATPLYMQVSQSILEKIQSQEYLYGAQIPSEYELGEIFSVSRITIRKAISDLEAQGYLIKKRGKGTFVSYPKVIEIMSAGGSFTKSCRLLGAVPSTHVISKGELDAEESLRTQIPIEFAQRKIFKVERLRLVNGIPAIFEIDYFHDTFAFLLDMDLENKPILELIRSQTGLIARSFEDSFDIVQADKRLAAQLKVAFNEPLLKVTQRVISSNNELIYVNDQFVATAVYTYAVRHGG